MGVAGVVQAFAVNIAQRSEKAEAIDNFNVLLHRLEHHPSYVRRDNPVSRTGPHEMLDIDFGHGWHDPDDQVNTPFSQPSAGRLDWLFRFAGRRSSACPRRAADSVE